MVAASAYLQAQSLGNLLEKLNLYQQKYPEELVYLHSDRCRYSPGDMIWFKAYIMNDLVEKPSLSRDLYIGLVDIYGTEIARAKYLIDKDHVNGDLEIPAQASAGTYLLMAYTNWMQNYPADRIYVKEIIIEKEAPPFDVKLKLSDSLYFPGDGVMAEIECLDNKNRPVMAPIQYKWLINNVVALQGTTKTDKSGRAQVNYVLPNTNTASKIAFNAEVIYNNSTAGSGVLIPTPENMVSVLFYPESGALVSGLERKIAFRAFNMCNRPVELEGGIIDNQNRVMKISGTPQGVGSFTMTPKAGREYYLELTRPAGTGRTFELPELLRSGVVLTVKDKTPDTLTLEFQQINKRIQVYHFVGQMKGQVYWMESRKVDKVTEINIPLRDFPAGVAEIAAFDSVMNPVASRLLYVNQYKRLHIEVLPDKVRYGKNENITLTLRVKDESGNPLPAVLSLAAGPKIQQQTYAASGSLFALTTLTSNLSGFVADPESYFEPDDIAASLLDNLLLVSQYSRFTWKQVMRTVPNSPSYSFPENSDSAVWQHFNRKAILFCKEYLSENLTSPGLVYSLQQKNDPASWSQGHSNQAKDNIYSGRQTVLEIIDQIKPYSVREGKIYFDNSGVNSISNQDGAIIVINGKLMGTDIEVLNGILPSDIDHIRVSTNVMDIQQYTALNTMGVIEIYTKVNEQFKNPEVFVNPEKRTNDYRTPSVFNATKGASGKKLKSQRSGLPGTLYWNPDIRLDADGIVKISFKSGKSPGEISVSVEGISETGLVGNANIAFPVK